MTGVQTCALPIYVSKQGANQVNIREDGAYQQAEFELRTLLERFANGQSMQPMFDAVNQLYTDAKNDDELRCADLSLLGLRDYLHPFGSVLGSVSSTRTSVAFCRSPACVIQSTTSAFPAHAFIILSTL